MSTNLIHLDRERMKRRGDKPMDGVEKLDEAQWLLNGGLIPENVARQLGTNANALAKLAERHGRVDLARTFGALSKRVGYAA